MHKNVDMSRSTKARSDADRYIQRTMNPEIGKRELTSSVGAAHVIAAYQFDSPILEWKIFLGISQLLLFFLLTSPDPFLLFDFAATVIFSTSLCSPLRRRPSRLALPACFSASDNPTKEPDRETSAEAPPMGSSCSLLEGDVSAAPSGWYPSEEAGDFKASPSPLSSASPKTGVFEPAGVSSCDESSAGALCIALKTAIPRSDNDPCRVRGRVGASLLVLVDDEPAA